MQQSRQIPLRPLLHAAFRCCCAGRGETATGFGSSVNFTSKRTLWPEECNRKWNVSLPRSCWSSDLACQCTFVVQLLVGVSRRTKSGVRFLAPSELLQMEDNKTWTQSDESYTSWVSYMENNNRIVSILYFLNEVIWCQKSLLIWIFSLQAEQICVILRSVLQEKHSFIKWSVFCVMKIFTRHLTVAINSFTIHQKEYKISFWKPLLFFLLHLKWETSSGHLKLNQYSVINCRIMLLYQSSSKYPPHIIIVTKSDSNSSSIYWR